MLLNSRYKIIQSNAIGRGSYSRVYLGQDIITGENLAIKKIDLGIASKEQRERLTEEIKLILTLDHPNLVKTYDVITPLSSEDEGYVYIIMEYCGGGDFEKFLTNVKLKENKVRYYMYQLMQALQYLRGKNILHRDLKPANLLLSSDNRILKVADFGFARTLPDSTLAETLCGTPLYMAPELLFDRKYTSKSDLWSVGVIMYRALYGRHLYPQISNGFDLLHVLHDLPISYPKNVHVSPEAMHLLRGLLQKDPVLRLSWSEFFHHPWFDPLSPVFNPHDLQGPRQSPLLDSPNIHTSTNSLEKCHPPLTQPLPIPSPPANISLSYSPHLVDDYISSAFSSPGKDFSSYITDTMIYHSPREPIKIRQSSSLNNDKPSSRVKDETPKVKHLDPVQHESTLSLLWNAIKSSLRLFSTSSLH